jgi:hypothetical protein
MSGGVPQTFDYSIHIVRQIQIFKTFYFVFPSRVDRGCQISMHGVAQLCLRLASQLQFKSVVQRRRMPSSCADATRVNNLAPSIQLIHVRSHCDTQPPNGDTHPKLQVEWDFPLIPPFVPSTKSANFVRAIRGPSFPLCNIPLILFSLDGHDQTGAGQPRPAPLASLHHASTLQ